MHTYTQQQQQQQDLGESCVVFSLTQQQQRRKQPYNKYKFCGLRGGQREAGEGRFWGRQIDISIQWAAMLTSMKQTARPKPNTSSHPICQSAPDKRESFVTSSYYRYFVLILQGRYI